MALCGYIRVSRVGGRNGDSFISPEVQREQILNWAKLRKVEIGEWFEDLDQSGGKVSRPGLDAALARIEAGKSEGIVVAKVDRLARSLVGALEVIQRLDDAGATFVSVAEGIDPTTPAGKMLQRLMLLLAEFELDRIREGWADAQRKAVEKGIHVASRTPTGYLRGTDRRLEPHPNDAPVIAELFRMRAGGASWSELAAFLNASGTTGPYANELWTNRAMEHILRNRVYLGEARSGPFTNPDAHEAIVDRATWEAAQRVQSPTPARSSEGTILAGLLRCTSCRHTLKPDTMKDRNGERLRFYRCRKRHSTGECPAPVSILERKVLPDIELIFHWWVREQEGFKTVTLGEKDGDLAELEAAVTAAEAELAAYRDEAVIGALGAERYVAGLERRARAVDEATAALAETKLTPGNEVTLDFRDEAWPMMTVTQKRKWLFQLFDAIMVRPADQGVNRLSPILRGQLPEDFPRRGKRTPIQSWQWPDESKVPQEAIEIGKALGRGEWPEGPVNTSVG
jgi:site-specific DNA recombinase